MLRLAHTVNLCTKTRGRLCQFPMCLKHCPLTCCASVHNTQKLEIPSPFYTFTPASYRSVQHSEKAWLYFIWILTYSWEYCLCVKSGVLFRYILQNYLYIVSNYFWLVLLSVLVITAKILRSVWFELHGFSRVYNHAHAWWCQQHSLV